MAKALTTPALFMHQLHNNAIKAFLATYQQTKLVGNVGAWDWAKAEKHFVKRAIAGNLRGQTGFQGDVSNVGQVP